MNFNDAIRSQFNVADFMVDSYLSDLTPAELLARPVPGANHIAWQLGHLISAETRLIEAAIPGSMPALPAGFAERHTKDTAVSDNPADFLTKDEYLSLLQTVRAASLKALDNCSEADLDKPVAGRMPPWVKCGGRVLRDGRGPLGFARRAMGGSASSTRARPQVLARLATSMRTLPKLLARTPSATVAVRGFSSPCATSHSGRILFGSPRTSANVVLRKACSTSAKALSSRRWSGHKFVPCVANSSGQLLIRRIGSVAFTISRIVNLSAESAKLTPPLAPRWLATIPAFTSACRTLTKYAGGTCVTFANSAVVLAAGAIDANCTVARKAYSTV